MLHRVWDRGARDEELSEELRAFVEHDADSKIRAGMTAKEARRAALIELGGAEQVKERVRDAGAEPVWKASSATSATPCAVSVGRLGSRPR